MGYTRYVYNRIFWLNKSESLTTPLGKTNLNRMDSAIYNIAENLDVVNTNLSEGKFDKADADKVIVGMPTWNPNTGILAFRFYDGTTFQVDFNVEKIPVSFSMDSSGLITMTTSDGTKWTANIGDVIPDYTFTDSDTIAMTDTKSGQYAHTVSAQVKKGSITGDYLQPDYLADVTTQANNAKASAQSASGYADNAAADAKMAQSYAIGGSGMRDGENTDNSKYYKEKSEQAAQEAEEYLAELKSTQVTGVKGDSETTYRKGDVNLTPANIGAIPLSGSSAITGNLEFSNSGTTSRGIIGTVGDNDYWRIIGGATAANAGYLEIATADDGNEPIYVRQYSSGKFGTLARTATLLDASGNTSFPGTVAAPTFSGSLSGNATSASRNRSSI